MSAETRETARRSRFSRLKEVVAELSDDDLRDYRTYLVTEVQAIEGQLGIPAGQFDGSLEDYENWRGRAGMAKARLAQEPAAAKAEMGRRHQSRTKSVREHTNTDFKECLFHAAWRVLRPLWHKTDLAEVERDLMEAFLAYFRSRDEQGGGQ